METTAPYVARTPEDVLATVPLVLGFEPEDSLVLLTFGAAHPFHARVDLPRDPDDVRAVCDQLVWPALQHRVARVLLVAYTPASRWGGEVLRRVGARFESQGIEVLSCLRADAGRWWPVEPERSAVEDGPGSPYDARGHRFRARSVLEGRVTLPDRAAVAASVAPRPDGPAPELLAALVRATIPDPADLEALLDVLLESGDRPDDEQVAELLAAAAVGRHRDRVARRLGRDTAQAHVALWSEVVRRAPRDRVADAAGVLALAAWVAGDGALAWCAVDRAREAEPAHVLSGLVAGLLEAAVPPQEWEQRLGPLAG
jgi:hypothetical protein